MVRLRAPRGFDIAWVAEFLGPRAVPAMESVSLAGYRRSLRVAGRALLLDVRFRRAPGGAVSVEARSTAGAPLARALVERLLDLRSDLGAFGALAAADPPLARLVESRPGLRLMRFLDPFEGLVRAILGQQVSVAGARTLADRLVRGFGEPLAGNHGLFAFPAPEAIATVQPDALRSIGLTRAKTAAIRGAARATCDGLLDWERLARASPDDAQAALISLPGIGPWTASYLRMRVLGDRDAFPAADLGVRKALQALSRRAELPSPRECEARAERWRPWRAYAALHLWRSLSA